jgi:hypothetical protein
MTRIQDAKDADRNKQIARVDQAREVLTLLQPRAFSVLLRQNRLGGQDKITPVTATGRKWEEEQRWRSIFFANGGAAPEGACVCVRVYPGVVQTVSPAHSVPPPLFLPPLSCFELRTAIMCVDDPVRSHACRRPWPGSRVPAAHPVHSVDARIIDACIFSLSSRLPPSHIPRPGRQTWLSRCEDRRRGPADNRV